MFPYSTIGVTSRGTDRDMSTNHVSFYSKYAPLVSFRRPLPHAFLWTKYLVQDCLKTLENAFYMVWPQFLKIELRSCGCCSLLEYEYLWHFVILFPLLDSICNLKNLYCYLLISFYYNKIYFERNALTSTSTIPDSYLIILTFLYVSFVS